MALQKEIWIADIIEPLFAANTFAARSIDYSAFVDNRTVHVPNAGAAPKVEKNRQALPATVGRRQDADLTFQLAEYTADPILVPDAERVELSYDKRASVLAHLRQALADKVHADLLGEWVKGAAHEVESSAAKASMRDSILAIKDGFDEADIPQEGRCLLLTPALHSQLLRELTGFEGQAFLLSADARAGTVGRVYGFDVYLRSALGPDKSAAPAGFAWQVGSVCRALGPADIYTSDRDPAYYGDVLSAIVRAGGAPARQGGAGRATIKAAAA